MVTKYEDIFGRYERGNIGEEEYNETLKNELPNPGLNLDNFCLSSDCKALSFGFCNNPYVKLMKSER